MLSESCRANSEICVFRYDRLQGLIVDNWSRGGAMQLLSLQLSSKYVMLEEEGGELPWWRFGGILPDFSRIADGKQDDGEQKRALAMLHQFSSLV